MFLYLGPAERRGISESAQWKWEGEGKRFLREFTSKITANGKQIVSLNEKPNADFRVTAWTNVSGFHVPVSSSLTVYDPQDPSLVLKRVNISARSVAVQAKFSTSAFVTNVGAPAYVVDRRHGSILDEPIRYNSKDGTVRLIE